MKRVYRLLVLAVLALACGPLLAQSMLGQIQVKSALGQPLDAVIVLHPDYPGEFDQLQVQLAPAAAFERAGLDPTALKVKLEFKLAVDASGQKVIHVTSSEPVREPFLDFVLKMNWPRGQMLREYVVLLDPVVSKVVSNSSTVPPAYGPGSKQDQQAAAATPKPASKPQPEQQTQRQPVRQPQPTEQGSMPSASSVLVHRGDTLSGVAYAHSLRGVSYQQMLVALKAANPDAFFRDNVNALKAGAVLRIPTRSQALEVTRSGAIAAVRQDNQAWNAAHASPTMVASAGGSTAPLINGGSGTGDHLSLVPPGQSKNTGGGNSAAANQLRQQLARSKEALTNQKQAASDLQERVNSLEKIAGKNKQLLSLKNDEIAALQAKLAEARKQAGLPAQPASITRATALAMAASTAKAESLLAGATSSAVVAPATVASVTAAAAASNASAKAANSNKPAKPASKAAAAKPAPSGAAAAPWYEQLWARIALAVVLVLLIVWALMRRRKPADKKKRASIAHHFADAPHNEASTDEGDPLAQVPGEDDGEQELLAQLAENPDDIGLHLELASVYYERRDVERFEQTAEAMHTHVDDEDGVEWQDVLAMGQELGVQHPLFPAAADESWNDDTTESNEYGHAQATEDGSPAAVDPMDWDTPTHAPETRHLGDGIDMSEPDDDHEHDVAAPSEFGSYQVTAADDLTDFAPIESTLEGDDEEAPGYSEDPVDTKLDLARAYIDMGDHEGARAMLNEALNEGTPPQCDAARKLLDELGGQD